MAVKKQQKDVSWSEWPKELKDRVPEVLEAKKEELKKEIEFYRFLQYLFAVAVEKTEGICQRTGN